MPSVENLSYEGKEVGLTASSRSSARRRRSVRSEQTGHRDRRLPNLCHFRVSWSLSATNHHSTRRGAQCHCTHQVVDQSIEQHHPFSFPQASHKEPLQTAVAGQGIDRDRWSSPHRWPFAVATGRPPGCRHREACGDHAGHPSIP